MNYPDLGLSKIISFDIETYDPELKAKGTGVYRKDGNILGCALSNGEFSEYYNIGHTGITAEEKQKNLQYIKDVLKTDVPKLATNILYDADWLQNGYDMRINGKLNDVQIAEPLICEYRASYSLNALSEYYLKEQKRTDELKKFCETNGLKGDERQHIYLMPYELVREYAKGDVELPLRIFEKQLLRMKQEELLDVYEIETGIIPLLLQMKKCGARIDVTKVNEKTKFLRRGVQQSQGEFDSEVGYAFNVKSPKHKKALLDKLGIPYEYGKETETGQRNPILDKAFLKTCKHPLIEKMLQISEYRTILATFFENSFTEMRVGEYIHCNFNPLKADEYGTISGRFSSTNPNLQQIPKKKETMGTFCREVFIPEEGMLWGKLDWSQIEYRIIAHYATGTGAEEIIRRYNEDPNTDYHQYIMDLTGLEREDAKRLNFGVAYFMGVFSMSKKFNWSLDKAKELTDVYFENVPFLKTTRSEVVRVAKARGYLRTILKRRARISPFMINLKKEYSIFNRLIQGSAADLMKKAMYDSYKAGVFNTLVPHITVHDELDVSIPQTPEGREAIKELKHIMETCIKIKVPIIAELEIGDNWGNVSKERANDFINGQGYL